MGIQYLHSVVQTPSHTKTLQLQRYSQSCGFPVVVYRCESWTMKKAECWRIGAFKLWTGENSWESPGQQGDQTSES